MVTLYRCDVCYGLIDPVKGDERTELTVTVQTDGEDEEKSAIDMCESCRPTSAGDHMDWLTYELESDHE